MQDALGSIAHSRVEDVQKVADPVDVAMAEPSCLAALDLPRQDSRAGLEWSLPVLRAPNLATPGEGVDEGARNATAIAFAGHLLRKDVYAEAVFEILAHWNAARCRPPLEDKELAAIFDSVCRMELARRGAA